MRLDGQVDLTFLCDFQDSREALSQNQKSKTCHPDDIVNCFADPCLNKAAACDQATGRCVVVTAPPPSP